MVGVPALDDTWIVCDGQEILDPASPLFGLDTPNLNSDKYESGRGVYLRGGSNSGQFNESTQLTDNGYKYSFSNKGRYYGSAFFSINDAEDYLGSNNAPGAFYSESHRVRARFQVAAMTVTWAMKIK